MMQQTMNSFESSRKRPRWVMTFAALLLSHQLATPADCFAAAKIKGRKTALFFRDATTTASTPSLVNFFPSTSTATPTSSSTPLPSWLSNPHNHLAEYKLSQLHVTLQQFFSAAQAHKIQAAVAQAAGHDRALMAGAADFVCILVETMELVSLHALVAAAYHYVSCVQHRQQHEDNDDWSYPRSLESFGEHTVAIAQDASRLKQLEIKAAAVLLQSSSHGSSSNTPRRRLDVADGENFRSLLLSETKDWRGLAIRSAACLYRLRGILQHSKSTTATSTRTSTIHNNSGTTTAPRMSAEDIRVAREALYIYAPLASRLGMHRLKNELENAAFEILYPRQYERVTSLLAVQAGQRRRSDPSAALSSLSRRRIMTAKSNMDQNMHQILKKVSHEMQELLANDVEFSKQVEHFTVTARVKEPYSMWKKMLTHKYDHVLQVPDALALRIVLDAKEQSRHDDKEPRAVTLARERALCYYAQKLCLAAWQPASNPRFKDYIEYPKTNGYQSLHYTAHTEWAGEDWRLEIQIRSGEMHQVAEFGLASHWDYKLGQQQQQKQQSKRQTAETDPSADAYLRKVQQWHWQQHGGAPEGTTHATKYDTDDNVVIVDRIRAGTQRLEPYIQALTHAQSDLTREFVFVFLTTPQLQPQQQPPPLVGKKGSGGGGGKVLALPAGACVLDALRAGHANHFDQAFCLNGDAAATVTRQLHNGDVLTVPMPQQQQHHHHHHFAVSM